MSDLSLRPLTDDDMRLTEASLDGLVESHASETRLSYALNEFITNLREIFIERDCDGDHRIAILVDDGDRVGLDNLKGHYISSREMTIDEEISELMARMAHDHAILDLAWTEEHAAMMLPEADAVEPALLSKDIPAGLIEDLRRHIDARASVGLLESVDASWPVLDDGFIQWLEGFAEIFSKHYDAKIKICVRDRKKGEQFLYWSKVRMPGCLGFYEHCSNLADIARQRAAIPERLARIRGYDPACA